MYSIGISEATANDALKEIPRTLRCRQIGAVAVGEMSSGPCFIFKSMVDKDSENRRLEDPALLRGLTQRRLTRRRFLKDAGLGAGILTASTVVAACERMGRSAPRAQRLVDWDAWWDEQQVTGMLDFANWPYYIDRRRDNSHPSLDLFTERTGIRVNYYRPIRDNARFITKTVRPTLGNGRPTGYDIIVITNGPELSELFERSWLIPLDHRRLPNFDKYASPLVRNPPWDPGNIYTVAWQSGLTGIAFRPEAVDALGREPTSIRDLWAPALAGKVGMLVDLLDLGSFALLAMGVEPSESTPGEWAQAARLLVDQRDLGYVHGYFDQGYLGKLQKGEIWIAQAWSGDIFQANQLGHPELRFVVPDEGAMLWTDNMMIPILAPHPLEATTYIDFVYDPFVAAMIADWVWYMTPVPAAQRIIANRFHNKPVATSPLVFPGKELLGETVTLQTRGVDGNFHTTTIVTGTHLKSYYVFRDASERHHWERTFGPVVGAAVLAGAAAS